MLAHFLTLFYVQTFTSKEGLNPQPQEVVAPTTLVTWMQLLTSI